MIFLTIFPYLQPVTVTWSLLTVSLVVLHAGLNYLHNCKDSYMRLYGDCDLILCLQEDKNISVIVLRVVLTHTVCMQQEFSPLFLLQSPHESPKVLTTLNLNYIAHT